MIIRNCAGGIVFDGERVFLLQNEKQEWVLPKGAIRDQKIAREVALERVKLEAGIDARILGFVGETSYEFYSLSRRKPVCNQIQWYLMRADTPSYAVDAQQGFFDGGYFAMSEALKIITYSQDRTLVRLAHNKLCKLEQSK